MDPARRWLAVSRRPVPAEAQDDLLARRDDVLDLEARVCASLPHFGVIGLQALAVGDAERIAVQDDAGRMELEVTMRSSSGPLSSSRAPNVGALLC